MLCYVTFYSILFYYIIVYYIILYYTILYYTLLHYITLYYIISYYTILYCTTLYYIILHYLYYIILYYIILYYIILYYIILYYIILYYITLYYIILCRPREQDLLKTLRSGGRTPPASNQQTDSNRALGGRQFRYRPRILKVPCQASWFVFCSSAFLDARAWGKDGSPSYRRHMPRRGIESRLGFAF